MKKIIYWFFLLLLPLNSRMSLAVEKSSGVCISQGGRFPPFASEGKPPKKASRGSKDLTFCRLFRKKTCCDVAQTHSAFLSYRRLATRGEASEECLHLWELLECSICDPRVGVQRGPPLICGSFCDRVFQACSTAYFSMDTKTQVLAPCGVSELICATAVEWTPNGTELCRVAGFTVKLSDDMHVEAGETSCYGGKANLDSIADSWRSSQSEVFHKVETLGVLEDLLLWIRDIPFSEKVSWTVGGILLTAGLFFLSKRKSRSQRQKLEAIKSTAKKLQGKMSEKSPGKPENRRGNRR